MTPKRTAPDVVKLNWGTVLGGVLTAVIAACAFTFYRLDKTMAIVQNDLTYIKGTMATQDNSSKAIWQALDIRIRTLEIEVAILKTTLSGFSLSIFTSYANEAKVHE